MRIRRLSPKSFRQFTLASIASACMFASTAHADFYAESHACKNDASWGSEHGVGNYYYPSIRIALTHMVNENFNKQVTLYVELWAYAEGGTVPVFHGTDMTFASPGTTQDLAAIWYGNTSDSPGHLESFNAAWHQTMLRFGSTTVGPNDPFDGNGCRTQIASF